MSSNSLNVLLVESDQTDAEHIIQALSLHDALDDQHIEVQWVQKLSQCLKTLSEKTFDAVMIDLSLDESGGMNAIALVRRFSRHVAIVAVAGKEDHPLLTESIKEGAQDFILKLSPGLECVRRSVRYAIERKKGESLIAELAVLKQRDMFIAMLAHDLRNPLVGCERVLSLMLEGQAGEIPEEQARLLSIMKSSHKGLLMMISNVLDCYRMESGRESLDITEINLSSIVSDCLAEMTPIASEKNIRMYHCFSADVMALADKTSMRRVINNLLSNALKFTAPGGEIHLYFAEEDEKVIVNIEDTGMGIAANEIESLFEMFFQCQKGARGAGLGIGLNICKRLMDAQNGTISCSSEPGKGTTFVISLPRTCKNLPCDAGEHRIAENPIKGTIFEEVLRPLSSLRD